MIGGRERTLHLQVASSCNNNCIFCMECRWHYAKRRDIPLEFHKKTLEDGAQDFRRAVFTSAEPTLYKDLPFLVQYAKKLHYPEISLITNGRMLSNEIFCNYLIKCGLNMISVSVHGHNKQIHETMTRTPGSFEQTKKGIENVSKQRKKGNLRFFSTNTTITKMNYLYLEEMYDFAIGFNPDEIVFNYFNPIGKAKSKSGILMPKYSDINKILKKLYENKKRKFILADFPVCVFRDMLSQVGHIEDYHLRHKDNSEEIKYQTDDTLKGKRKLERCGDCYYYNVCHGIDEIYLQQYGDKEFSPIMNPPKKK